MGWFAAAQAPRHRLLARLKTERGRRPTPEQLIAGDFNGNGRLDDADYQALRVMMNDEL